MLGCTKTRHIAERKSRFIEGFPCAKTVVHDRWKEEVAAFGGGNG